MERSFYNACFVVVHILTAFLNQRIINIRSSRLQSRLSVLPTSKKKEFLNRSHRIPTPISFIHAKHGKHLLQYSLKSQKKMKKKSRKVLCCRSFSFHMKISHKKWCKFEILVSWHIFERCCLSVMILARVHIAAVSLIKPPSHYQLFSTHRLFKHFVLEFTERAIQRKIRSTE